jgi:hypothetical protein
MTTVWRIAPDAGTAAQVEALAKKEFRPVANMLKVLVHEALWARQFADGKSQRDTRLTNMIRGHEVPQQ